MKIPLYALALLPIAAFAQAGLPTTPYIYVEGKAEIEKAADMAILHFDVVARSPDVQKANVEVQTKANKVFDIAKGRKISNDDVIAESLRSEPQYENEEGYQKRGKIIGYTVTRSFRIKVRDVGSFPKLADDIIAAVGAEFSSIDGGLQKEKEVQDETWTKAVANAGEQAEKTGKTLGVKIDSVFAISPAPVLEIASTMFPKDRAPSEAERVVVTGSNIPTAEEMGNPSQYHLAPITLTQIVHVIYLISPTK